MTSTRKHEAGLAINRLADSIMPGGIGRCAAHPAMTAVMNYDELVFAGTCECGGAWKIPPAVVEVMTVESICGLRRAIRALEGKP